MNNTLYKMNMKDLKLYMLRKRIKKQNHINIQPEVFGVITTTLNQAMLGPECTMTKALS